MKIVIPTPTLAHRQGGIRVLCELANGLVGRGHEVRFLTFQEPGLPAFPTRAAIETLGPAPRGPNLFGDLPRQSRLQHALDRCVDADILIANHHLTAGPVHRAHVSAGKFYYIQAYEPDFYPRTPQRIAYVLKARASYRYPLHQIANSPSVARAVRQDVALPIVPPGIDPAIFHSRGRSARGGRLVVGTIGRIEPWKGTRDCFEAVRRVRATGIELDFRVAFGNIPAGYEDDGAISLPRTDTELAEWYRGLDILIAAVHGGGAPYPPLEAMACGTAVVTTPNDHVREGVTAFTAPQQDARALGDALAEMIRRDALREQLVRAGLESVAQHHWEHVTLRLEDILTGKIEAPLGPPRRGPLRVSPVGARSA